MEEKSKIKITIEFADVNRYNTHQRDDKMSWETSYTDVSLDEMLLEGLRQSIIFVAQKGSYVHPDTVTAYNEILLND